MLSLQPIDVKRIPHELRFEFDPSKANTEQFELIYVQNAIQKLARLVFMN